MGKLWRRSAGWSKPGGIKFDVKFKRAFESEREKHKRTRHHVGHRDADLGGRQRTMPVRRLVMVGIMLVRAVGIRVVISVNLVNQLEVLQQRM